MHVFHIIYADTGKPALSIHFDNATDASTVRACLATPRPLRIARIVNDSWRIRESLRIGNGTYEPLPAIITQAKWFVNSDAEKNHFAHRANSGPDRIAFTPTAEKGMEDKQTVLTISRYLARFFGEKLRSEDIAKISALYATAEHTLTIGNDAESFRFAYSEQDVCAESSAYLSCMRYTAGYFRTPCHPAEAYSAGDLAIAYITSPDDSEKVIARAVIWPARMQYVRVYGADETVRVALISLLESDGYDRAENWRGARIRAIRFEGRLVLPFIDGNITSLEYDAEGDGMIISGQGDIDGSSTRGWTEENSGCMACQHCEGRTDEVDGRSVGNEFWCQSCALDHTIFCECDEEFYPASDSFVAVMTDRGEQTWHCSNERYAFLCERDDIYYCSRDFTPVEVITRHGELTWCEEDSEELYFACEKTGKAYSREDFHAVSVETTEGVQVWEESQAEGRAVYCAKTGAAYLPDCVPDGLNVSTLPLGKVEDTRQLELI